MEATAKIKMIGKKDFSEVKIILPDSCSPYLEKYSIEMIEHSCPECLCIYFQDKNDLNNDVVSHTVNNHKIGNNTPNGFKAAFEKLVAAQIIEPSIP